MINSKKEGDEMGPRLPSHPPEVILSIDLFLGDEINRVILSEG
jgi:hypothetical protein